MSHRALCVGINDYPGTNMDLAGCVNDARDWQALLEARGYRVDLVHDGEATRARIVEALTSIIGSATEATRWCSPLPVTVRGSPTRNRDEPDARDEMMCPFDVMKEQYLLDDDLNKIFCTKRAGVRLYVIADCCHSGSVVTGRTAAGPPDAHAIEGAIPSPVRVRAGQPPVRARDRPRSQRARADEARLPGAAVLGLPGQRVQLRRVVQSPPERRVHTNRHRRAAGRPHRLAARAP